MTAKSHYSAQELVELVKSGLPGLPSAKNNIIAKATRESWQSRPRTGKGGGLEYAFESLPPETRLYLTALSTLPAVRASVPVIKAAPELVSIASLADWQRSCTDARLGILRLLKAAIDQGYKVKPAIEKIITAATSGELPQLQCLIPLANARAGHTGTRTLGKDTVLKWWSKWKNSGFQTSALVPDGDRQPLPEPAWVEYFLIEWRRPQKPELTDVLSRLKKSLPPHLTMPTYDQARYYLKKSGTIDKNKGRITGNQLSALKPYRRRITDHMYPGDAYTADGHCFDGEVAHPYHGRPFRPEITPVLDVYSRMCVGFSIDLAESGLAVLDALRIACENFAVPVIFYTDNGSGFKNQMMTAPGTGILHRLGITPEYSRPRNPQAHGLSERGHQTILVKAAKELCTYMGKAMDNDARRIAYKETRKAIRTGETSAFLIEWDDFIDHINAAIVAYNNRPHSGLPAYRDQATKKRVHYTPAQMWQLGMKKAEAELHVSERPTPANDMPDLYHPAEIRTVDRGYVQLGTMADGKPKKYFSKEMEERHGDQVQVAYSPSDASKVWVRDLESGRLIAVAELGGNSSHYFADSKLDEGRYKRGKARIKRLENHIEEAKLEMHGPKKTFVAPEPTPQLQQLHAKLIEMENKVETPAPAPAPATATIIPLPLPEKRQANAIPADERERYYLWRKLEVMKECGEELYEEEENFFEGFKRTAIWKAWKKLGR
ncbi:MAG: transposase [Geobacteraceae bacterium]|nr:transposase [Geobacteraceae bacterium]